MASETVRMWLLRVRHLGGPWNATETETVRMREDLLPLLAALCAPVVDDDRSERRVVPPLAKGNTVSGSGATAPERVASLGLV